MSSTCFNGDQILQVALQSFLLHTLLLAHLEILHLLDVGLLFLHLLGDDNIICLHIVALRASMFCWLQCCKALTPLGA